MRLEIESGERNLESDLFDTKELSRGKEIIPVEGVKVTYDGTLERGVLEFSKVIYLMVDIAKEISIGVFSAWLYDKLKGKNVKLKIKDEEVEINKSKIEEKIREKFKT